MNQQEYIEREHERAQRLLEFVQGELRNMFVGARFKFTIDLFVYLSPEIQQLLKEGRIKAPD